MEKDRINVALAGLGRVGSRTLAVLRDPNLADMNSDINLVGAVTTQRRSDITTAGDIRGFSPPVDVVICAYPDAMIPKMVPTFLKRGLSTVDCYCTHSDIGAMAEEFHKLTRPNRAVAITGTTWGFGPQSPIRGELRLLAPYANIAIWFCGRKLGSDTTAAQLLDAAGIRGAKVATIKEKSGEDNMYLYVPDKSDRTKAEKTIGPHPLFKSTAIHLLDRAEDLPDEFRAEMGMAFDGDVNASISIGGDNRLLTAAALCSYVRAAHNLCARGEYGCKLPFEVALLDRVPGRTREQRVANLTRMQSFGR